MARKKNYLNNRDLLKEIHTSKKSYCSYKDKELYSDYDYILNSVDDIFCDQLVQTGNKTITPADTANGIPAVVEPIMEMVNPMMLAKQARAKRLAKIAYDAAINDGKQVKQAEFAIDPESYRDEEMIFRINTFEHIPLAPPKVVKTKPTKRRKKVTSPMIVTLDNSDLELEKPKKIKYVKIKFPPFFHYMVDTDGKPYIVAKSHWEGGLEDGHFNTEHGTMTDKLALMFMKLCERYATKSNWRGYTYNDEMRGQALLQLAHVGLRFNEARSDNPFAYYTAVVENAFTRILNVEKENQKIRDDILEANDLTPSYTRQNENDIGRMEKLEELNNAKMTTEGMTEADWWRLMRKKKPTKAKAKASK